MYKQESFGVFVKEEVYFFREVGNWVTEMFGSPKWRMVPLEELWRWSKEWLESIVAGKLAVKEKGLLRGEKGEMGRQDELEVKKEESSEMKGNGLDAGPAEAVLEYLKRRVSSNTSSQPSIYNLCQSFYQETKGQAHSDRACGIARYVLCESERVYRG